jgi:hypothetical protein
MLKKTVIFIIILIAVAVFFAHPLDVQKMSGHEWEKLDTVSPTSKYDIVSGVLTGFGMVEDYAFDINKKIPEKYESFDEFIEREGIVEKIVKTLDRYYRLNRSSYKYNDRVANMIIVIFGKYWWKN